MPTRPKGQKRPTDVIGNAVKVMQIATGEEQDFLSSSRGQIALSLHFRRSRRSRTSTVRAGIDDKAEEVDEGTWGDTGTSHATSPAARTGIRP